MDDDSGSRRCNSGDGAAEELPYPETDFSPALQRTLQRKLENGEMDEVDRKEFFKLLGQMAEPQDEPSDEER